ncbi:hypothetical protein RB595_007661 [Gaeumannomyces hyphopodioides]
MVWIYIVLVALSGAVAGQKTPISQKLFDTFKRYAEISSAVYASTCPTPPGGVIITNQINNRQTDTQGFIARDDAAAEIIVSFRGTSNVRDFQVDLQEDLVPLQAQGITGCDGCLVHEGFLSAWNSVAAETISAVQAEMAASPNSRVIITGHSLGGSLASLATVSMLGSGINVTTYTYGQPRTGNKAYADFVDQRAPAGAMFRVTHANDGVPQAVAVASGYQHHSTEYWQENGAVAAGVFQCTGQEPTDCNNSVRGTGLGPGGVGINAAHLSYMGVSTGNPADQGSKICGGNKPGFFRTVGGLLGVGGRGGRG